MKSKRNRVVKSQNPVSSTAVLQRPYTSDGLADLLEYHRESVRRACRAGRIKAIKIGREWRITQDEAGRILAEGLPAN